MGLFFDDELIVCPKCGSKMFKEEKHFGLDKIVNKNKEVSYKTIQPKFVLQCTDCGEVLVESNKSLLEGE